MARASQGYHGPKPRPTNKAQAQVRDTMAEYFLFPIQSCLALFLSVPGHRKGAASPAASLPNQSPSTHHGGRGWMGLNVGVCV
ncbi:hypothetical protein M5D96_002104, partial [Drosophila gunungcola]